jgi:hypothetical protein
MKNRELLWIMRLYRLRRMTHENWFLEEKKGVNRCQVDLQKKNAKGETKRYKERLVEKGYSQSMRLIMMKCLLQLLDQRLLD